MDRKFSSHSSKLRNACLIIVLISTLLTSNTLDSLSESPEKIDNKRTFSLVLSGGGSRGFAQIGVIKALEEAGLRPSLIVGTSMGAIIGSMYATGLDINEVESILKRVEWSDVFSNRVNRNKLFVVQKDEPIGHFFEIRFKNDFTPILPNSISHGQSIYDVLAPILSPALNQAEFNFDSLCIPLRVVASDILTGDAISFSEGDLSEAVRGSSGIPFTFAPISKGKSVLVDGGLVENIPVKTAKKTRDQIVVAVDVTSPLHGKEDLNNPVRLYDQIVSMHIAKNKDKTRDIADFLIKPDLTGVKNSDFKNLDSLVMSGYREAKRYIPELEKKLISKAVKSNNLFIVRFSSEDSLLSTSVRDTSFSPELCRVGIKKRVKKYLLDSEFPFSKITNFIFSGDTAFVTLSAATIKDIVVYGNFRSTPRLVRISAGLKIGERIEKGFIERTISSLYASGLFHNVNVFVDNDNCVQIKVVEKDYFRTRVGLRFDEYNRLEGFIQPAFENIFGAGIDLQLHLQYGRIREKYALDLSSRRPFSHNFAGAASFGGFISKEKVIQDSVYLDPNDTTNNTNLKSYNERSLTKFGSKFILGSQLSKVLAIETGIKIEKFQTTKTTYGALDNLATGDFREGLRRIHGSIFIDNLDRMPFPRKGQKHYVTIQGATDIIDGSESFFNLQSKLSFFQSIFKKHTFNISYLFTWANKSLPAVEKIYFGGNLPNEMNRELGVFNRYSFIGMTPASVSGDIATALKGGYRYALTDKVFFDFIVDWGYVWNIGDMNGHPDFDFSMTTLNHFKDHAPLGLGLGVSVNTVLGPLKLFWGRIINGSKIEDLGIVQKNTLYFSAGHDF